MKQLYKEIKNNIETSKPNKRINIFLSKEDYKQLIELKYKYRLGIGYLVRIIEKEFAAIPPLKQLAESDKLYNTRTMKKTCIKIPYIENDEKAKFYNNAVIIYIEKLHKKVLTEKQYSNINNQIANVMSNTQDPLWNYNEFYRLNYLASKFQERK